MIFQILKRLEFELFLPTFYQVEGSDVISPCDSWQKEAEEITQPFLDALGDDYSVCCQGMMSFCSFFFILILESTLICSLVIFQNCRLLFCFRHCVLSSAELYESFL